MRQGAGFLPLAEAPPQGYSVTRTGLLREMSLAIRSRVDIEGLGTTDGRRREARLPPGQSVTVAADRIDFRDGDGAWGRDLDEGPFRPAPAHGLAVLCGPGGR